MNNRIVWFLTVVFCITFWSGALVQGQDSGPKVSIIPRPSRRSIKRDSGAIRLDVNLVLIPVMVTDTYERPVKGLRKESFKLFEDGVEQNISQVFSQESPISIGILFDSSASMAHKMEQSRLAVSEFLRMSVPDDEFFLMRFSDRPVPMYGFTKEIPAIEEETEHIQAGGWTALYDAIYLAMNQMRRAAHDRKVLLVLSDGGDNNSRYSEREIKEIVREGDVRIFAISILNRSPTLEKIAAESGGRAYRVKKLDELPELAANVSADIHSEYVLGYLPTKQPYDGKYRKLRVELVQPAGAPPLHASWRHGYYGPAE